MLAVVLGAAAVFLTMRPRPHVSHPDQHAAPTSSFPSGHTAAPTCLYVALAIVAIGLARDWWQWLALVPAIVLPILVAASRMYRGEHHPTEVLGSLVLAGLWLTAATMLLRPNAGQTSRADALARARRTSTRTTRPRTRLSRSFAQ